MSRRLRVAAVMAIGVGLAAPRSARAQGGGNEAAATALFDEGRKLMDSHDYAGACPKLAESQRLAPSGGTLLNLAECYEKNGQTASAWVAWKDTASRANAAGKADVEKKAVARANALEPLLARLIITVTTDVPGLQVKRDGVIVGHAEFGVGIPVDPGSHVVEASAPYKEGFTASVVVAARQTDAGVTIALADAPSPAPAPVAPAPVPAPAPVASPPASTTPPQPADTSTWNTQKTLAVVAGGIGVAGVAIGSVFGLEAKSKNDQALLPQNCPTSTRCTPTGLSLTSDAQSAASLSTITFIVGGVALAAGVVLWVTAPSGHPGSTTGVRLVPSFGLASGGLAMDASF